MENQVCVEPWKRCLTLIKDNLSDTAYKTWFAPIVPLQYEDKVLVLQVPSLFFVEYIEEKYIELLRAAIYREFGVGTQLEYKIPIAGETISGTSKIEETSSADANKAVSRSMSTPYDRVVQLPDLDPQLNSAYTFNNLIEGRSNKLARTAGISIANEPGKTIFSPLFVYGQSGVGKTNFYQTIDLLIIDDIHEFAGKTATQNTFFHIFNHLHLSGKQLILTADRAPAMLAGLEQRLLTRFKWGLSAEIEKPDFQLRKDILKSKIYRDGLDISEAVIDFIAENVVDNVRDLEGVLVSLMAHSTLENTPIDLDLARQVVSRIVKITPKVLTVEKIRDLVCEHFALSVDSISTKSRKREVVQARQIAMYLSKQLTKSSLSSIGTTIGQRDHATVLHACKIVADQMEIDKHFRATVQQIESKLKS